MYVFINSINFRDVDKKKKIQLNVIDLKVEFCAYYFE